MILKEVKVKIEHLNLVTNCYIIVDEETKEAMVIDPGAEAEKIVANVDPQKKVCGILITHSHQEHIGAITEVFNKVKFMRNYNHSYS